jgi:hypothetical protein
MKQPKKGRGLLGDIAKELAINMAKSARKFAIDKGADYAKGKIEGLGMLRKASPKQLASLAKARSMIGMKKKAKITGSGRSRKKIYGSALYPGGY